HEIVAALREQKYTKVLANLEHVTYLDARARFVSAHSIEANKRQYSADRFLLAINSTAHSPAIPGIEQVGYLTHIEALRNKTLPRHLLVVGAGPVALEFAQMFRHFRSTVTLLARGERLYSKTEPEISDTIKEVFNAEDMVIRKQTRVNRFYLAHGE